jgi:hypothetical protein
VTADSRASTVDRRLLWLATAVVLAALSPFVLHGQIGLDRDIEITLTDVWIASPDGAEHPIAVDGRDQTPCASGRTFSSLVAPRARTAEDVFPFPPQWIRPGELLR